MRAGQLEALRVAAEAVKGIQLFSIYGLVGTSAFVAQARGVEGFTLLYGAATSMLFLAFIIAAVAIFYIAEELTMVDAAIYSRRIAWSCLILFFLVFASFVLLACYLFFDFFPIQEAQDGS